MSRTVFLRALVPGRGESHLVVDDRSTTSIVTERPRLDPSDQVVDLEGRLLIPALVEPHAHLDKAFLADRVSNPSGDLRGAIDAMVKERRHITEADVADRAERAVRLMASFGVTRIRTHVDTTMETGLVNLLGVLEARRRCGDLVDLEVAVLLDWPLTGSGAANRLALARDAIAAGADVVGGCPHLDDDPVGAVHVLVDLALEHNTALDLHADENLRHDSDDLGTLARRINADGLTMTANASHCVSLSVKSSTDQRRIAEEVATAGITVTVLPQTNLYLQARGLSSDQPRGIAPVSVLREAGVTVAAGGDNLQDPFNPIGSGDPLETAALTMWASHQSADDAMSMVSVSAAKACSGIRSRHELSTRNDFVALEATSVRDAIARRPPKRLVIRHGVVV